MKNRIRSKAGPLRTEQLRRAKWAQRLRLRSAGIVHVQLALPGPQARKLAVARRSTEFLPALDAMLDLLLVRISDYSQLQDLAWNRSGDLIPAKEAFSLYERNWRFIDVGRLDENERALIERLKTEFGNRVING